MHLIEQYALTCGVKIDKPSVELNFFPTPFDKYIIIHPSSGMGVKSYSYFNDVIDLILPLLRKENINLIQIGADKDRALSHCHHLQGKTSLAQSFYLIKNSVLLLGNDSFSTHVASGFNNKLVSLYSTNFKECCGPYWGNPDRQILLQADRNGQKPSFSDTETPKVIDNIKPEEIGAAVLNLLGIKHKLKSYKTLNIGKFYNSPSLEVVPDSFFPINVPEKSGINIRLDYNFNLDFLFSWASRYPSHIITDAPIPLDLVGGVRKNITKISIDLKNGEKFTPSYLKELNSKGVHVELFTSEGSNLKKQQLEFLDWGVRKLLFPCKKDLDFVSDICNNSYYYSSKTLLSNKKTYSCKAAWLQDSPVTRTQKIIDDPTFWKEIDYFRIFNKK